MHIDLQPGFRRLLPLTELLLLSSPSSFLDRHASGIDVNWLSFFLRVACEGPHLGGHQVIKSKLRLREVLEEFWTNHLVCQASKESKVPKGVQNHFAGPMFSGWSGLGQGRG